MKRRGADIALAVSLVVALAIVTLWVRGLFVRDELAMHVAGHKCLLAVYPHHVYLRAYAPAGAPVGASVQSGLPQYPSRAIYWELRYHHRPGGMLRLGVPFWLPLAFAMVVPLWRLLDRIQLGLRHRAGLCQQCGYDLRASRDRCPECGEPIPAAQPAAASPSLT